VFFPCRAKEEGRPTLAKDLGAAGRKMDRKGVLGLKWFDDMCAGRNISFNFTIESGI